MSFLRSAFLRTVVTVTGILAVVFAVYGLGPADSNAAKNKSKASGHLAPQHQLTTANQARPNLAIFPDILTAQADEQSRGDAFNMATGPSFESANQDSKPKPAQTPTPAGSAASPTATHQTSAAQNANPPAPSNAASTNPPAPTTPSAPQPSNNGAVTLAAPQAPVAQAPAPNSTVAMNYPNPAPAAADEAAAALSNLSHAVINNLWNPAVPASSLYATDAFSPITTRALTLFAVFFIFAGVVLRRSFSPRPEPLAHPMARGRLSFR